MESEHAFRNRFRRGFDASIVLFAFGAIPYREIVPAISSTPSNINGVWFFHDTASFPEICRAQVLRNGKTLARISRKPYSGSVLTSTSRVFVKIQATTYSKVFQEPSVGGWAKIRNRSSRFFSGSIIPPLVGRQDNGKKGSDLCPRNHEVLQLLIRG